MTSEHPGDVPTSPTPTDIPAPPAWLDEVEGGRALAWVRERNAHSDASLAGPDLEDLQGRIREVLDSPERIPFVSVRGTWAYNFWTDGDHPRGVWRRQHLEDYLDGDDSWDVLLDVDALSAAEGHSWVFHGASRLHPDDDRALVDLSEGGSDADVTREFDLVERTWVDAGFERPTSKGSLGWITRDTVWASTDMGPGTVSASGYPLQARVWRRGEPLQASRLLAEGSPSDLGVFAGHDHTPGFQRSWVVVAHDFHHSTTHLVRPRPSSTIDEGGPALVDGEEGVGGEAGGWDEDPATWEVTAIDAPSDADVSAWREWLLISLHDEWDVGGRTWPAGSLLAFDLEAYLTGARRAHPLFTPDDTMFLQGFTATRHHLVLDVTVDVVPGLRVATPPVRGDEEWAVHPLDLASTAVPAFASVSAGAVSPLEDDRLWLTVSGFTTPTTLLLAELDADGRLATSLVVRRAPALFDTTGVEVAQHFATSLDGTRVPYFQVGRPAAAPAGAMGGDAVGGAPTLLYGYGGFEVSLLPAYSATVGRAWLERGGTYVVANIRGGGEYGPAWHRAALRRNRHRAYEDFEAVARDLVARGVTTPAHLGIQGGSNGGLLTGNMLVRTPELFGAVVIQVPLLDMRRYHTLLAGSSWMSEYGDPDDPDQWQWLRGFSPFHLLDRTRTYPPVMLTTSTRDDRVHPAHARTMTWRLLEMGADVTYVENTEGGHAGAADNAQRAHVAALVWEFLWRRIG